MQTCPGDPRGNHKPVGRASLPIIPSSRWLLNGGQGRPPYCWNGCRTGLKPVAVESRRLSTVILSEVEGSRSARCALSDLSEFLTNRSSPITASKRRGREILHSGSLRSG